VFSLIITIMAVALVVVLIAATMYYGGSSVSEDAQLETDAIQTMNEISQIRAAIEMYQAERGTQVDSLETLVTENYLSAIPGNWSSAATPAGVPLTFTATQLSKSETENAALCAKVNEKLGLETTPLCSAIPATFHGCCRVD